MTISISDYPIDFVVTWVDGSDAAWRAQKAEWLAKEDPEAATDWLTGEKRYRDWGLLRYWFRGVEECAPWVRTIHFVTWGHLPEWLDTSNPKLNLVKHLDFIPTKYLPTFNSHTIELNLHRIPGLAEHFVYFNDDMYLLKEVHEEDFFKDGLPRDFAGLNCGFLSREFTDYRPFNAMVINEHFDKKEVIRKNRRLWLNPIYGPTCLAKTLALLPWKRFSAMQTDHLPINFLKSTFKEVWEADPKILDRSCAQRFRGEAAVSPWLMRDWQRAKGEFVPKGAELDSSLCCGTNPGTFNEDVLRTATVDETLALIEHPKGTGMICINDYCNSYEEFERWGTVLHAAFERHFPRKSGFEK